MDCCKSQPSYKNYLNENFVGQPIDEIPGLLKKGMTAIRNEINMLLKILTEFIKPDEAGCIVNGQSKLVENDDLSNINKIKKDEFSSIGSANIILNNC